MSIKKYISRMPSRELRKKGASISPEALLPVFICHFAPLFANFDDGVRQ